jgi:FkbM family methyltransferase
MLEYGFQMINLIRHLLVKIQNALVNYIVTFRRYSTKPNVTLERLGSVYGGWWVPKTCIEGKGLRRVAFSVGIGHDVTFDKQLLKNGFLVIALDPLAECVAFAEKELSGFDGVYLNNLGLSTYSGKERFFSPRNSAHDSWSSTNSQLTSHDNSIVFDVISLADLISKYKSVVEGAYTILKMDIEGAESKILQSLCDLDYVFDYVAIEMDCLSLIPFLHFKTRLNRIKEVRGLIRNMNSRGYELIKTENFNYFWSFEKNSS